MSIFRCVMKRFIKLMQSIVTLMQLKGTNAHIFDMKSFIGLSQPFMALIQLKGGVSHSVLH
jgi:hypothetical protein